ncbi:14643_t:CDS:2, partial [Racocetra fulgida]
IYGDVREILTGIRYAYVIYYDLRDAVNAYQFLRHQGAPHNQHRLKIQFSSKPCAVQNRFDEVDTIRFARSLSVGQTLVLLIEYYDTRAARAAKESINGIIIEGVQILVQYYDIGSHSWDAVAEDFKHHQKIGLAIPPLPRMFLVVPSPGLENRSEDMAKVSSSSLEN